MATLNEKEAFMKLIELLISNLIEYSLKIM